MYDWIIEADIARLKKEMNESASKEALLSLNRRLESKETQLAAARRNGGYYRA